MPILVLLLILWIIYDSSKAKKSHSETPNKNGSPGAPAIKGETDSDTIIEPDYRGRFQKKYMLTRFEYGEYKKLKQIAAGKNLLICPKVRLLDLIEPRRGDQHYKTLFYKIQAKHVDFVICDQNLYVKAILELDDNSHNQSDRKARDQFVDTILTDVGYKVLRVKSITEATLDEI